MKVKLQDVVDMMDSLSEEMSVYLNKRTGELYPFNNDEFSAVEDDEDLDDYPEWQRESILKAREVIDSEDWIEMPAKEDIDDYAIMEEFCHSIADPGLSARMLGTIRGSGAFGRFRAAIDVLDLRQEWYDFRAAELEKLAVEWLETNAIAFSRGAESAKSGN